MYYYYVVKSDCLRVRLVIRVLRLFISLRSVFSGILLPKSGTKENETGLQKQQQQQQ